MERQELIDRLAYYVRKYARDYNICVHSPIIAQGILESGWGDTKLASQYNNYFGMKCGSRWTGKSVNLTTQEEYTTGSLTTIKDNFRVYDSFEDGVKGYFEFIQLARYQNLKGIKDAREYLQTIKDDGYATASKYVEENMALINQYNLTKYDQEEGAENMTVIIGSARIDENGNIYGGQNGDQTGQEVSTQEYYLHSKGWYCSRPKDATVAVRMALAMKNACDNPNWGYNQYNRCAMTMIRKYGSTLAVAEATATDCSNLVRGCIFEASGVDVGSFDTSAEVDVLESSGLFENRFEVTSSDQIYEGDVLTTKTKGHTVIAVVGKSRNGNTQSEEWRDRYMFTPEDVSMGATGTSVLLLQEIFVARGFKGKDGNPLTLDRECGENTVFAINTYQSERRKQGAELGADGANDGICGQKMWADLIAI